MMAWRPIETAPDMGTKNCLLWNGERVFVGWLHDNEWHDATNVEYNDPPESPQPTHWMPLPEPPQ